ncbi:MAG TPA: aminotransferase class IV, partial [Rhizomicrobium sp.]
QHVLLTLVNDGVFASTTAPLGPAPPRWTYALSPHRVSSTDQLLRHKTTWRDFYDGEQARLAQAAGSDEALFRNDRGELTEGSRSSLFLRRDGKLLTPPLTSGLLDGVLRRELLETGQCEEAILTPDDLASGEVLLGNSLRGLIRAEPASAARAVG